MHAHPTRAHNLVNPTTVCAPFRALPFERTAYPGKEVAAAEKSSGPVTRIAERLAIMTGVLALATLRLRRLDVAARPTARGAAGAQPPGNARREAGSQRERVRESHRRPSIEPGPPESPENGGG